jgi:hypothetical protein
MQKDIGYLTQKTGDLSGHRLVREAITWVSTRERGRNGLQGFKHRVNERYRDIMPTAAAIADDVRWAKETTRD